MMPEMVTPQLRGLGAKSVARRGAIQIISGQEYRNDVLGHLNLVPARSAGARRSAARSEHRTAVWHDRRRDPGARRLRLSCPRRLRARDLGRPGAGRDQRRRAVAVWHLPRHRAGRLVSRAQCRFSLPGRRAPAIIRLAANWAIAGLTSTSTARRPSTNGSQGAAEGRSFMTSGPLVLLDVDGRLPGDMITTARRSAAHRAQPACASAARRRR